MSKKKPAAAEIAPMPANAMSSVSADQAKKDQEYETKRHMETLMDAEQIKQDPQKMKRVSALAGRHSKALKAIRSVQDIKNVYNQKFGAGAKEPDNDE